MKISRIATAMALMCTVMPIAAQAKDASASAGRVVSANGGVFIARDGKLIAATSGQSLFKNDRIVTRADANAQVSLNDCNAVAVGPTSIVAVDAGCGAVTTLAPSKAGYAGGNAMETSYIVGGLAVLLTVAGVVIVSSTSP